MIYPPGFYRINPRALRLRELIRWRGIWRLPFSFLATRAAKPSGAIWLPSLWADCECSRQELTDRFWQITSSHHEVIERLGFSPCLTARINKLRILDPRIRDTGVINYIHANRFHLGSIRYSRTRVSAPIEKEREEIVFNFSMAYPDGVMSCNNFKGKRNRLSLDALEDNEVIRIIADSPEMVYARFLEQAKRRTGSPLVFPDIPSLQRWVDERQIKRFEDRVRRGVYVRMTDAEVNEARRKLSPPPLPPGLAK